MAACRGGQRLEFEIDARQKLLHMGKNLSVALFNQLAIIVIQSYSLPQDKQMLLAIISFERLGDLMKAALDAAVFHISQFETVAFSRKDSSDYAHTSHSSNIA